MQKIHTKKSTIKIMYTIGKDSILEILVPRLLMDCKYQPLKADTVSHVANLLA